MNSMEPVQPPLNQTSDDLFNHVPDYLLSANEVETPPTVESTDIVVKKPTQKISAEKLKTLPIRDFAFDLVIYGSQDKAGVLAQHGVSEEELEWLLENHTSLMHEIQQVRAELDSSPESGIRMRARNVVEIGLMSMHDIITGPFQDPQARVKAFEAAAKVADLLPKATQKQSSAPIVEINFGPSRKSFTINQDDESGVIDVK